MTWPTPVTATPLIVTVVGLSSEVTMIEPVVVSLVEAASLPDGRPLSLTVAVALIAPAGLSGVSMMTLGV